MTPRQTARKPQDEPHRFGGSTMRGDVDGDFEDATSGLRFAKFAEGQLKKPETIQ